MKTILKHSALILSSVFILTSFATGGYKVGDQVKDFSIKNVNGKMVSLADYTTAKGFIVVFTCNHCPYSKAYEQRIMDLDKKYSSKGYPVIAISSNDVSVVPDDSYDNMAKRAKEKKYSFPYLYDESQAVAKQFGAMKTPQVFVISKITGGMKLEYTGAIDDNTEDASAAKTHFVEDAVNALLAGKKVSVTESKAIGCSIKFKK